MNRTIRNLLLLTALTLLAIAHLAESTESLPSGSGRGDINGTEWRVEHIAGGGVIDASHTTVQFPEPGRVAGDSGCNRYTGAVTLVGSRLAFGPLAGTRRACAPALMDQEQKFYKAMGQVVAWELADSGLMHLKDAAGNTLIRAARLEESSARQ